MHLLELPSGAVLTLGPARPPGLLGAHGAAHQRQRLLLRLPGAPLQRVGLLQMVQEGQWAA